MASPDPSSWNISHNNGQVRCVAIERVRYTNTRSEYYFINETHQLHHPTFDSLGSTCFLQCVQWIVSNLDTQHVTQTVQVPR